MKKCATSSCEGYPIWRATAANTLWCDPCKRDIQAHEKTEHIVYTNFALLPMATPPLSFQDVQDVLDTDILIGSDSKTKVRLVYRPSIRTFTILKDGQIVDNCRTDRWPFLPPEFIAKYNQLIGCVDV